MPRLCSCFAHIFSATTPPNHRSSADGSRPHRLPNGTAEKGGYTPSDLRIHCSTVGLASSIAVRNVVQTVAPSVVHTPVCTTLRTAMIAVAPQPGASPSSTALGSGTYSTFFMDVFEVVEYAHRMTLLQSVVKLLKKGSKYAVDLASRYVRPEPDISTVFMFCNSTNSWVERYVSHNVTGCAADKDSEMVDRTTSYTACDKACETTVSTATHFGFCVAVDDASNTTVRTNTYPTEQLADANPSVMTVRCAVIITMSSALSTIECVANDVVQSATASPAKHASPSEALIPTSPQGDHHAKRTTYHRPLNKPVLHARTTVGHTTRRWGQPPAASSAVSSAIDSTCTPTVEMAVDSDVRSILTQAWQRAHRYPVVSTC